MSNNRRFDLAISLLQAQDFAGAEKSLMKVLKSQPGHVGALNTLAILLARSGKHPQAEKHFLKAIQVFPSSDATYYNYGITLRALGRLAEARDMFDKSLAINPSSSDAWNNRGVASSNLGDFRSSIIDFDKAIFLNPGNAAAYANKAKTLAELERREEALAAYAQAIAISPNLPEASLGLGQVLSQLTRHNEALAAYDRAIALKPDLAEAWFGRGLALLALKQYGDAYAACDRAIKLMPELDYAPGKWLHAKMHCCLWDDIENAYQKVLTEVSNRRKAASPFNLLSIPSTLSEQKIAAETYVADNFPPILDESASFHAPHSGKIRVGYFSADFHRHAIPYLTAQLLELHDRSKFEILGFSFGPSADDDMRLRLNAGFDQLIDVKDKSDDTTASDALWSGLPLVTRLGDTFAGRVAASLLNAIGLPDLVTRAPDEYEQLALELSTNRDKLSLLKRRLAENRLTYPLFDSKLFTKHIESAYQKMWERHRMNLKPDHFSVDAS